MDDALLDIYTKLPGYYDVLFPRDYAAECEFLDACLRRHGSAQERSFLEVGCGPARNARELAARGYRAVGLDLAPAMVAFAEQAARQQGVTVEAVQGDMTDFALASPVALAACLWDTLLILVENQAIVRHLRAVARNLLPGGVYVIEMTHPRARLGPPTSGVYRGRSGDVDVEITWGLPDDPYDSIAQVHLTTVRLVARRGTELVLEQVERLPQRWYGVQELRALIELSGAFSEVHLYGRSGLPFLPLSDSEECDGALLVLVKGKG
jgi:SAM-dependent methyltransferase